MATWPDIATASLLESLPPAMLDEIVCRLPIRDAARTSVLSRFWCRRWMSVPYQVLHWPVGTPPLTIYDLLAHRRGPLVYMAIGTPPLIIFDIRAHRTCPVRDFRHPYVPEQDFDLSNLWLDALAGVGVQALSVKFQWSELLFPQKHTLDSSIFSCRSGLTVLDLEGCDIPYHPPPGFGGFPNLTTLSLSHVGFPRGVRELEGLISSSPSLLTLRLQDLRILNAHEQWVIHAPNLQRLLVKTQFDYRWQINSLPAIEVADISWKYYSDGQDFVQLISVLEKARKLKLSTPFAMENMLEGLSRSFVNLKNLSLHIPLRYQYNILAILHLVRNAPKLEALDIEHDDHEHGIGEPDINSLNVPWADDLLSSLTSVHMKNVIWDPYEILFIQFVLSKARQLEIFSIHLCRGCSKSDEEALAEVARYRRASPGANLVIRRMPQN